MTSIKAPEGGVYRQEFYKCNKDRCKKCRDGPGHGPYWSRYWWEDGKTRKEYIGKTLPKHVLTKDSLTKDKPLPKILTKDKLTKDRSLPKIITKDTPRPSESLPKTVLPKTDGGLVERAIDAIRDFHSRGEEPSVSQIAEIVGGHPKHLGRWLKEAGLEAKNVRRGGTRARRYTFDLKEKIQELQASGIATSAP